MLTVIVDGPVAPAVRSWCRVVGGSGQTRLITHEGAVLVDEGFV
jgi:hypothetical protein